MACWLVKLRKPSLCLVRVPERRRELHLGSARRQSWPRVRNTRTPDNSEPCQVTNREGGQPPSHPNKHWSVNYESNWYANKHRWIRIDDGRSRNTRVWQHHRRMGCTDLLLHHFDRTTKLDLGDDDSHKRQYLLTNTGESQGSPFFLCQVLFILVYIPHCSGGYGSL